MEIVPFGLERWFDEYEHDAEVMLAESGIRSLDADRFDTDPGELGYVIPTDGDPEFRAEVGERYGRSAEEVCFTCGTQEANYLVFRSLLDSGDHAVVVTPTYQALSAVPESICEVSTVSLSAPDWELDLDAVAEAIRPETRLLVLNNPNNPTGKYHSRDVVEALYDLAEENDAYLLCDEVYRLLCEEPLPPVASMGEQGISTASLTKAYGLAGLRFGWIAGPEEVIEGAVGWKDYTTISPSIFGQHVARQALGEQEESILTANRELAREHHDMVTEWITEHDLSWHDPVGVNGFVSVPEGFDSGKDFCRAVVEDESVVLAPGEFFGFEGYFRLGFGLETEALTEGLDRVGRVIEDHE
ncbi:aminotransferase class I/II-fold pyridoxal phosphate-dependent enzyme [Halalkalicoccus subterraneus]|uniref:aminotransferase class I/II-fold pyridoxal phosphate-dependent enzyme n=1 Tax=Halalkalicoccus subterraneus TaxID=2675002 RepID=UPI000EFAF0BF|nr:aminotransferase class I/II-fold pyridoxal phosphate-dependent enzyme [Halalkalicoccus subterraneus]